MKVMKFGGSSVVDGPKIRTVADIVLAETRNERVVVVLSAMRGITDALIGASVQAEAGNNEFRDTVAAIRSRQVAAVEALFPEKAREDVLSSLLRLVHELGDILHGVELVRECSPRTLDLILSFGELLNCTLFTAYLRSRGVAATMVDTREVILTDDSHGNAEVDFPKSYERIQNRVPAVDGLPVVTGFIAATESGVTTTLGRNGSDYTASIVGAGVGARSIEIWTDVDGVYNADPRYVRNSFVLPRISYVEAMELSYFGAKVLHPYTMLPAVERNIPILIKNTLNPGAPGTVISADVERAPSDITGLASVENVSLINVEGGGMVGIPGIASRVFSALARAHVNVIMISQASSEHSICIVCREEQAEEALGSLKYELAAELHAKKIQQFELIRDLEIVAVIGANMRGKPGISGRVFSALGKAGVNVLAIAQGSSEMNISFVVERRERETVLNVVHDAFFGERNNNV